MGNIKVANRLARRSRGTHTARTMTSSPALAPPAEGALERAVVDFIRGFERQQLKAADLEAAKTLLKDQLAVQIGASQLPWSRDARRCMTKPRPGSARVVAETAQMDAGDAAYLNAVYGGGFEYDDVAGNGHPGCCVIPVALALGEELGATLGEVIEAMVTGYETYVRIGRLGSPDLINRGWHAHSVLAHFGGAAVAAKLYRLDAPTTHHALANALSHACGTTEYTSTGGSIKRIHAGIAARNSLAAVDLARGGITGPRLWLTGRKGFYRTFIGREVAADGADLFAREAPLMLHQAWLKAYCCCGAHHPYIDAMAQIRGKAQAVTAVEARVQTMTANLAARPEVAMQGPQSVEELQFCLQLQMALSALGLGNGYATHQDFLAGRLLLTPDSDAVRFAQRIRLVPSPALDERFPRNFVADVTVHYQDGSQQDLFVEHALGMPGRPFSAEAHRDKVQELTFGVLGQARAQALLDCIDALDFSQPVQDLTALLAAAPSGSH